MLFRPQCLVPGRFFGGLFPREAKLPPYGAVLALAVVGAIATGIAYRLAVQAEARHIDVGPPAVFAVGLLVTLGFMTYAALRGEIQRRLRAEALLHDAIESFSDGFVLYDARDRIVFYNEKYRELRQHDPAIRPGQDFVAIVRASIDRGEIEIPPADLERWIEERLRQHRDPVAPLILRIGERWIRVSERKTGEGGVVSILSDITELKTAQAAAEAARARMADWTDIASDWLWEADPDGNMTFLSESSEVKAGIPPADRIGQRRIDLPIDADLDDRRWRAHLAANAARRPFRNFVVETPNWGSVRHVSISGRPMFDAAGVFRGYRGTTRNVTMEVEAQRALARQTAILTSLVENLPVGVGLLDRDLRLMAFNQPFLDMRGIPAELAHVGAAWRDILRHLIAQGEFGPGDPESMLRERMTIAMARERMQFERVRPNGRVFDAAHIPLPDGGCIAVFIDVTEKRRMERLLAESQKMEAVGRLTGGLAHDFNNLLGIVIGNLDGLIDLLERGPNGRRVAAKMKDLGTDALDAALRGAELVRRLVAFSRGQPLQPKRLDVSEVVRGIAPLLERSLGERIAVDTAACDVASPVMADPAHLENALLNLALNARDAMPDGGRLTIACGQAVLDDPAAAALELPPGSYATITVSDTGTGIAPDILARVFEPFFTTKEVGKGSGLGLSTVYGYARQSGGTVRIASQLGRGTDVQLYLPRAREGHPAPHDPDDPGSTLRGEEACGVPATAAAAV